MGGKLKDLFIPFCQEPRVAHSTLKRAIVLNRGRCVPTFKKEVQRHKGKLKKVTRFITHATATSNYSDIVKKSLAVQPVGYVSYILPEGAGPVPKIMRRREQGRVYCGLMETVIFFCRYADDGVVAKLARKGKAGRQVAESLADASYYWNTIGKPITKEWLKFGFRAAMPLAKFGLTGNIPDPEPAFSLDSFMDGVPKLSAIPQVKGFVDTAHKTSKIGHGSWGSGQRKERILKNDILKRFEELAPVIGELAHKKELYKLGFVPNQAYVSPFNMGQKAPVARNAEYPDSLMKLPAILRENGFGLVHNFMGWDVYKNSMQDRRIAAFKNLYPHVVAVTQFTPLLVLNDEMVFACRERVLRVRQVIEDCFLGLVRDLNASNDQRTKTGGATYYPGFVYPDWYAKDIRGLYMKDTEYKTRVEDALRQGLPAFLRRSDGKMGRLPGGKTYEVKDVLGRTVFDQQGRDTRSAFAKGVEKVSRIKREKPILSWGIAFENPACVDGMKRVFAKVESRTHMLEHWQPWLVS